MSRFPLYDEAGKHKLLEDMTAADVGYAAMRRYVPKFESRGEPTEQHAEAQQSVALLKLGIMPLIVPRQDATIYATVWLQAASEAAGSLQNGANPMEVFSFLQTTGPAIRKQLDRIASDPTRKQVYDALEEQWKKLAQITDKIGQQLQRQAQQQREQQMQMQQQAAQQNGEFALKARESQFKIATSEAKTRSSLQQKSQKHSQAMRENAARTAQELLLADAKTAAEITRQNRKDSDE